MANITYYSKFVKPKEATWKESLTPISISRIELIDSNGRAYVNTSVKSCEFSFQDNDKTLKIFIK